MTTIRTAGARHPYAELNMKHGVEVGYDAAKLIADVRGQVGIR